jgi:signal transduction histidine kinase
MKGSLYKKLSIGFLFTLIISILIVSIVSNKMIDNQFNQYLSQEHKSRVNNIIKLVEELYLKQDKNSVLDNEEIMRYAVLENFYIEVRDKESNLIFTSGKEHLMPNNMMNSMMGGMMNGYYNMRAGEYIEEKYPLEINNNSVGTIIIGYFGNWNASQEAMSFKMTLNQSLIIAGIAALIIGLLISLVISRGFTIPLVKISMTADEMTKGNLGIRAQVKTNTSEIYNLSKSINYLAETLQQQDTLRKRLSSDMAHEIRTPLTTVKTYIEAIMDGIWEPTKERLASCYEELERITRLTDNLQNLAKVEQANLVINKVKFDVSSEIKKILNTFEPMYGNKNILIIPEIEDGIIVNLDRDKFKEIMYNLLSNAYKYSEKDDTVSVRLKREDNWVKIEVEDNGIGIDEKDLPFIFERFYRGDISRSRDTGGAGIGLTITKTLVEVQGGKIEVESIKGKGSIFRIKLPM